MRERAKSILIREFIYEQVSANSRDVVAATAKRFRISRQAVHRHIRAMVKSGALEYSGHTRARTYRLKPIFHANVWLDVAGLEEHVPWDNHIRPGLKGLAQNVLNICNYGFTEMVNNVIDHSESEVVNIECSYTREQITLQVMDEGVGIFRKICDSFGLPDELAAIAELAKGKLTTDPARHSGEGIFFTSRIFDYFSVLSGTLCFAHTRPNDDWLIEDRERSVDGTHIKMTISPHSTKQLGDVFNEYSSADEEYQFSKTNVPVKLLQYGSDNLVSRSQAKRLLARFEAFREVILDFDGVLEIGQAFADEVFRVYAKAHPDVNIRIVRATPGVSKMISRARSHKDARHESK